MSKIECLLCNSENVKLFHSKLRYNYPAKAYKCCECEFVFMAPIPTVDEIKKYYSTEYRDDYEDESVEIRFNKDLSEANRRFEFLTKKFNKNLRVLEIGSGSGSFLSLASKYFNYVAGVELDINSVNFLKNKGLDIYSNKEELSESKFDLIVMFHVLEHFPDPILEIKKLHKLLNENGKILVEVPNINDALISLYDIEEFKNFYFCSAHISYFSPETLELCFKKAQMSGQIEYIQRYNLNNHLNWLKNNKPGFMENIFNQNTLDSYEKDLIDKSFSDTLIGIFEKNN